MYRSIVQVALVTVLLTCPTFTSAQNTSSPIYNPCTSKSALCFGFPENCVSTSNCQFLFRSHYDPDDGFHLTLVAPSIKADQYMAVGFSNQSSMSGLVTACQSSSSKDRILFSFNVYDDHDNQNINQKDVYGFTNLQASYKDGQLSCEWQVKKRQNVNYDKYVFDFETNQYYVQLAMGPFNVKENQLTFHHDNYLLSSAPLNLSVTGTINGGDGGAKNAIRWHASLMIFGWIGCVTVAILMARFTRDLWPEKKLFGLKYWFVFHRVLMISGWLAIVASYIIIFVQKGGWTKTSAHSVVGIVAGALATLQIGNSFLRPGPDSPSRWIFDYGHWLTGNVAHLLAMSNIIGMAIKGTASFFWLVIAYLFIYLLFSDLLRKLENRIRKSASNFESKQVAAVFQSTVILSCLVIVGIVSALIAILFID